MRTFLPNETEAGGFAAAYAATDPSSGPRGGIALGDDAAVSGDLRRTFAQVLAAARTRIGRVIAPALHGLRDARDRRRTARELRRLSPALLADIGIEAEEIDQLVETVFASRRNPAAMRGRESPVIRRSPNY